MFTPGSMKSSIVLCYNINKLTYLLIPNSHRPSDPSNPPRRGLACGGGRQSCGRWSSSSRGRYLMKTRRTHLGMRWVRGVLKVQLSEMTVLMMQQTSIGMVKMRYLANSGRLVNDGGSRLVTSTCTFSHTCAARVYGVCSIHATREHGP